MCVCERVCVHGDVYVCMLGTHRRGNAEFMATAAAAPASVRVLVYVCMCVCVWVVLCSVGPGSFAWGLNVCVFSLHPGKAN